MSFLIQAIALCASMSAIEPRDPTIEQRVREALDELPESVASDARQEVERALDLALDWLALERIARLRAEAYDPSIAPPREASRARAAYEDAERRIGERLGRIRDEVRGLASGDLPALARALVEAYLEQSDGLYNTARGFAEAYADRSKSIDGCFSYLAAALARGEAARLVARIGSGIGSKAPPIEMSRAFDILRREIHAAEAKTAEQDSRQILFANATLGESEELYRAGHPEAALHQYLRAVAAALRLIAPDEDETSDEALQRRVDELTRAMKEDADHSIGLLLVQRAVELVESGGDRQEAALLLDRVVPRYLAVVRGELEGAAKPAAAEAKITVTVLRWPYT